VRHEFHVPREDGLLPLKAGTRVGASSLRRGALLGQFAPQALSVPLRGNVPTRLRKLAEGQSVDAIVLAAAGSRVCSSICPRSR
jgi:hydroxymethylbilane synthase